VPDPVAGRSRSSPGDHAQVLRNHGETAASAEDNSDGLAEGGGHVCAAGRRLSVNRRLSRGAAAPRRSLEDEGPGRVIPRPGRRSPPEPAGRQGLASIGPAGRPLPPRRTRGSHECGARHSRPVSRPAADAAAIIRHRAAGHRVLLPATRRLVLPAGQVAARPGKGIFAHLGGLSQQRKIRVGQGRGELAARKRVGELYG
jgi:hypothetical protein